MNDPHEIIVTTFSEPTKQQVVDFSRLFEMREDIASMMYLWNTNCYYVNVQDRTFMINGGRKIQFSDLRKCRVLYRRRNSVSYSLNPQGNGKPERRTSWILGVEEKGTKRMVMLIIGEDGSTWQWANKL